MSLFSSSRWPLALFAFLTSIILTYASPVSATVLDNEVAHLEKRIIHIGRGTYYYPDGSVDAHDAHIAGNCGWKNTSSQFVVAVGKHFYDADKGNNCGQWIEIQHGGKTVYAETVDKCMSCGDSDIDMSPAVFKMLQPLSVGVLRVKWQFLNRSWKFDGEP